MRDVKVHNLSTCSETFCRASDCPFNDRGMDLRVWVSDNLIKVSTTSLVHIDSLANSHPQLSGASDPTVVDFVLATAASAKSSDTLHEKLSGFLDGSEGDIERFSKDLHHRLPKQNGAANETRARKEKEDGVREVKKRYKLLEMEDDLDLGPVKVAKEETKSRKRREGPSADKEKRREGSWTGNDSHGEDGLRPKKMRRRSTGDFEERWGDEEEMADEEFPQSPAKRIRLDSASPSPRSESPEVDEETRAEKARQRDLQERDEFAKRLHSKDGEKTKKLVEDRSSTKEGKALAQRRALADDAAARSAAMPDLRERSRQEYLKKREVERLALLRKQVVEEAEELRTNPDLSRREKEEFAKNREVLRIAEERLRIDDHFDGYMLPEDYITEKGKIDKKRKEEALYKRYVDRDEHGQERFVTEQEEWEREQTTKAKAQISRAERVDEGDYE